MKIFSKPSLLSCAALFFCASGDTVAAADSSRSQAQVTRIIRDVKVMPFKSPARPAVLDEKVGEGSGVRTGDSSRSELTFADLTITRLGANTAFAFNQAGRSIDLSGGSLLYRVPKDSGGGRLNTGAVTVGITGTTLILEKTRGGRNKLTVLEGGASITLNKYPKETAKVRGGQMIDVAAGATKLPPVVNVNVNKIMNNNPLITDFPPLPSRNLIYATKAPEPPPAPGPVFVPPIIGGLLPGIGIPIGSRPTTSHTGGTHHPGSGHVSDSDSLKGGGKRGSGSKGSSTMSGSETVKPHRTATPTKRKPSKTTTPVTY